MDYDVELGGIFLHNGSYNYDSDYTFEDELQSRSTVAVLMPILYSIVLAIGIPGNSLIMVFLATKKEICTTSETFVFHLGLSDIILLGTLPFLAAFSNGWCCGLLLCRITSALFNLGFYSGMLLLACITVERYLSIIRSVQLFTQKTPRLAHFTCILIWIASTLLSIPDWVSLLYFENENLAGKIICTCIPNLYNDKWKVAARILHHITFLLPVVAFIVLFNLILRRLQDATKNHKKTRSVMLILVLVLTFAIIWTPYNIALIVDTWRAQTKKAGHEKAALLATSAVACIHACVRPLIYLALCGNFKEKTLSLVSCGKNECEGELWDLGVGSEIDMPDQNHQPQELKQMTSSEQTQLNQC